MRYDDAVAFLYALAPHGVQLGLSRMEESLTLRGSPERGPSTVLIAGTNGKGSVASLVEAVLRAQGYRTGLYTSPHLHRITERIRIDGEPLSPRAFAARVARLAPFLTANTTPQLTFFEACTLLAFETFRDAACEVVVLEVGLGGRLDATNVVSPLASAITGIALDHEDRLGPGIANIAREKAGILRAGIPTVVGARDLEAIDAIAGCGREVGAPLLHIDRQFGAVQAPRGCTVRVLERTYPNLTLHLRGAHQRDNLACAVAVLDQLGERGLRVSRGALRRGIASTRWPGRLELLPGEPPTLLDAAHNPEACAGLAAHLAGLGTARARRVLLFGAMADKDHAAMLRALAPQVGATVFATPDTPRAARASALAEAHGGIAIDAPLSALAHARRLAGPGGLVIVAGSIFLVGRVRAALLGLPMDPTIAL